MTMNKRYLGNMRSKEVHDQLNEKPQCQLWEIQQRVYFSSIGAAKLAGYDPCGHCLPGSRR